MTSQKYWRVMLSTCIGTRLRGQLHRTALCRWDLPASFHCTTLNPELPAANMRGGRACSLGSLYERENLLLHTVAIMLWLHAMWRQMAASEEQLCPAGSNKRLTCKLSTLSARATRVPRSTSSSFGCTECAAWSLDPLCCLRPASA